jgi:hypothetical protein
MIGATGSILKRLATALSATTNRIGSFLYRRTITATHMTTIATTAVATAFTAAIMTTATSGSFEGAAHGLSVGVFGKEKEGAQKYEKRNHESEHPPAAHRYSRSLPQPRLKLVS